MYAFSLNNKKRNEKSATVKCDNNPFPNIVITKCIYNIKKKRQPLFLKEIVTVLIFVLSIAL